MNVLTNSKLGRRVAGFVRNVRIEYRARQLDKVEQEMRRRIDEFQRLSPAQRAATIFEQMEVERRLCELRSLREEQSPEPLRGPEARL